MWFWYDVTSYIGGFMIAELVAQMTVALATFLAPVGAADTHNCGGYELQARAAGWETENYERLSYIMWRESRCNTEAHNTTDPNTGSYGLTQINGFWCRPSRYFPAGWLQTQGILETCQDLHNPVINLTAARAIYNYGIENGNCPWKPWTTRKTSWCHHG
jgi:hypothetical protein